MIEQILKMLENNPSVGLMFKEIPRELIREAEDNNLYISIEEEVFCGPEEVKKCYVIFQKKVEIEVLNLDLVVKGTIHQDLYKP